jgi:prepilin-type N-terminal cleavage/methylation domain-containing protein
MRNQAGFSLMEMLAAVTLASVLLMVLLIVATSASRSGQAAAAHAATSERSAATLELIRVDVLAALRMQLPEGGLIVEGVGVLDPRTLEPAHRPGRIEYRVADWGDGLRGLVRTQVAASGGATMMELVDMRITGLDVAPDMPGADAARHAEPPGASPGEGESWMSPPPALRVTLTLATSGNPITVTHVLERP